MGFVANSFALVDIIRNARGMLSAYDEIKFREHWARSGKLRAALKPIGYKPVRPFQLDDYVEKITGDYHIKGYVVAVFFTKWMRLLRYVVEHRAEGGGSFLHVYSHTNLVLISRQMPDDPEPSSGDSADFGYDLRGTI